MQQEWILLHGLPNFLLSDQGSNVDGKVIHEICKTFGIEKRRTSAYHSQGNGFAERSIRNVKEIFRTHLYANNLNQCKWRTVLKELVFVLNTTISSATKCTPYSVVHGREAIVPEDVKLGVSKDQLGRDIITASDFAEELKLKLNKSYGTVNRNLLSSRKRMENSYNKSIRTNNYITGQKVWLRNKSFKGGESAKLAPRRSGPWTVVDILPNGRNFRIRNDSNSKVVVVHHDRIEPLHGELMTIQTTTYILHRTTTKIYQYL